MKKIIVIASVLLLPLVASAYGGGGSPTFIPVDFYGNTSWNDQAQYRWFIATNKIVKVLDSVSKVLGIENERSTTTSLVLSSKKATLYDPKTCKKKIVVIGTPDIFRGGWKLFTNHTVCRPSWWDFFGISK